MQHHGEKELTFKFDDGENKDPIGLKFQVSDVRKPFGGEGEQSRVGRR